MPIEILIDYFDNILRLNEQEKEIVRQSFVEKKLKRRQYLSQEGDLNKNMSFVVEGCLRMYSMDQKGKEHNIQFAVENWWVGDMGTFYTDEATNLNIEALEPCLLLQISKENLINLYVEHPKFNRIFRVLIENAFVGMQRRFLQNISMTAEERYVDFTKRHPNFFNRISNVQIASYLGVTPEFLSNIRKRIIQS